MTNLKNNEQNGCIDTCGRSERGVLVYFIEFVKFSTGFAAIVAVAIIAINIASEL